MNAKIRNEIQALIRIKMRNNNPGELREFIFTRKVYEHGETTYLITLRIPLYSITDWHRSPISDSHTFDQPGT
ncbi:hypothetical protein [Escherichia coli]|uniref:hypothetical protein n=1 Tax=Escherichia coli TaxID=562 RepID=UPI0010795B4C|nr:hypothetical protein [Escherichia coli]VEW01288.1 hypothetical protein CRJUMX02_1290001 [Escherichia coli]